MTWSVARSLCDSWTSCFSSWTERHNLSTPIPRTTDYFYCSLYTTYVLPVATPTKTTNNSSTGCFKKVASTLKLSGIFSLRLSLFCVKFCKFVGNSYPHTSTTFCRFILIFHQMALIFRRVPSFSPSEVLSRPINTRNSSVVEIGERYWQIPITVSTTPWL